MCVYDVLWWHYPNYSLTSLLPCLHPFFLPTLPFFCLYFFLRDHACSHSHVCNGQTATRRQSPSPPSPSFNSHTPSTPSLQCPLSFRGAHRCPFWGQALNNRLLATRGPVTCTHVGHMHASYLSIWSIVNSLLCKISGVFKVCFLDNDGKFFKYHLLKTCPSPIGLPLNFCQNLVGHVFQDVISVHGAVPTPVSALSLIWHYRVWSLWEFYKSVLGKDIAGNPQSLLNRQRNLLENGNSWYRTEELL